MSVAAAEETVVRFLNARAAKVDLADEKRLTGYAIVFNSLSQDLGGFKERIAPSAVDRTLKSGANIDALLDHRRETTTILGNTDSGLLRLKKDRHGLGVEITPPDTTGARDLMTVVKAGLVKGMSFSFRLLRDKETFEQLGVTWEEEEDGVWVRTIKDMEFSEVSVVVNPAYLETDISARTHRVDAKALEEFRAGLAWRPSLAFRERQIRAGMR